MQSSLVYYDRKGAHPMPQLLPGTPNDRIGDIRTKRGLTKKELSAMTGIAASQLTRIETGAIKTISSDILIKLAKALNVSTDFILGLTPIESPKNYDVGELGLSENALKALLAVRADMPVLNRFLEHKHFPYIVHLMKSYLSDASAAGVAGLNSMIDMATATLGDFMKDNPEHKAAVLTDARLLKSQKLGIHDAELEKLKTAFLAIVRDIKKDVGAGSQQDMIATADFVKQVQAEILKLSPENRTPEQAADALVNMVEQVIPLDGVTKALYCKLAMSIFKGSYKNNVVGEGDNGANGIPSNE